MVHIIFPVTRAALLHYYLPVLPAAEWDYFSDPSPPYPLPFPPTPPRALKGQLPIRRRERLLLNQLIKWLAVPSVLSFLITLQSCACGYSLRRKRPSKRATSPPACFSRSQLGLLLPLRLIVRVCAGPIPFISFFNFFLRVKLVLMSLNGAFNQSRQLNWSLVPGAGEANLHSLPQEAVNETQMHVKYAAITLTAYNN